MCEVQDRAGSHERQHVNEAVLDRDCKDRCIAPEAASVVVPRKELSVSELITWLELETSSPWQDIDSPITKQDVLEYAGSVHVLEPYNPGHLYLDDPDPERCRDEHIQRIKYLMSQDTLDPIHFLVSEYDIPFQEDGHHRAYAAWFSGRKSIAFTYFDIWKEFRLQFPKPYRAGLYRCIK